LEGGAAGRGGCVRAAGRPGRTVSTTASSGGTAAAVRPEGKRTSPLRVSVRCPRQGQVRAPAGLPRLGGVKSMTRQCPARRSPRLHSRRGGDVTRRAACPTGEDPARAQDFRPQWYLVFGAEFNSATHGAEGGGSGPRAQRRLAPLAGRLRHLPLPAPRVMSLRRPPLCATARGLAKWERTHLIAYETTSSPPFSALVCLPCSRPVILRGCRTVQI
jgi:hypothetical protein